MVVQEIWASEALVVFFLALPLLRPLVKKLWPLDGLVWLPLVALGIAVGIFPAYGFRPECLPMLVFALICNLANLSPFISSIAFRPSDSFRDRGHLLTMLALILLGAVTVPMFVFSPRVHIGSKTETESVQSLAINSSPGSARAFGREYVLRVYGEVRSDRPLIFLVPPEIGSAASIDLVCSGLLDKGYTVVTYSRKGYDTTLIDENGRKRLASLTKLLTYWNVFRKAASLASANEQGKTLEADRRLDIEFLLPRIFALSNDVRNRDLPPVILGGYGSGGSALAYLAGEKDFILSHGNVLGIIAIESRLWSSYLPEPYKASAVSVRAGMIWRQWVGILNRLDRMRPQRVSRTGPLPAAGLPLLYLVSGKALDSQKGQKPYQAVIAGIHTGSGSVALAAIESAGPLDYQDFPFTHPIYSFLLPGLENAEQSENPIGDTVNIIGNFATWLLERDEQTKERKINIPPRQTVNGSLYVESKGLPEFRL